MNHELRMAELLCTRLCHDLTGPIGAVNNGAEFLAEEGTNMQSQAVDLITSSAFSAVSRLQFYRFAYGNVKEGGEVNLADKQKLTKDFFIGSKIVLDWPDTDTEASGVSVSPRMARLIFNLLIVASGALMRGGDIAVRVGKDAAGSQIITITVKGSHIKWDDSIGAILQNGSPDDAIDAKNVQMQLTHRFIKELGATLAIQPLADQLSFEINRPSASQLSNLG